MKKSILILIILAITLTACGKSEPSSDKENSTAVPAVSNQVKETKNITSTINTKQLKFDESVKMFFGEEVDYALGKIEPLLIAASGTVHEKEYDFYSAEEHLNGDFTWTMIYRLRKDYINKGLGTIKEDTGDLILTKEQMNRCFSSIVADFNGQIPEIPSSLESIVTFDISSNSYMLAARDDEKIDFELRDITLSKANSAEDESQSATIWINILSPDGELIGTVCTEIIHNADSDYLYSVQSAWKEMNEPQNEEAQSILQNEDIQQTPEIEDPQNILQTEEQTYEIYHNSKVGFSAPYPSYFYDVTESDAGDGATFNIGTGEEIRVWGQYNVLEDTGHSLLQRVKDNVAYIVSESADDTSYNVIYEGGNNEGSGTKTFYQYGIIRGDKIFEFYFEYPTELKNQYDDIIAYMTTNLEVQ